MLCFHQLSLSFTYHSISLPLYVCAENSRHLFCIQIMDNITSIVEGIVANGSSTVTLDLAGQRRIVRLSRPSLPTALAPISSPPDHDPDVQQDCVALRDKIRATLKTTSSPPKYLVQLLVSLHGYTGTPLASCAAGYRLLNLLPRADKVDWSAIISRCGICTRSTAH